MTLNIPTTFQDTFKDKLANARKAVGAGVTAGIAAATPLFINALQLGSEGGASITGPEIGLVVGGFFGALASVGYVTWNTVNKPTPADIAALSAAVSAVPPVFINSTPPSQQEYDGIPVEIPVEIPKEEDETPVAEGYQPRHTSE